MAREEVEDRFLCLHLLWGHGRASLTRLRHEARNLCHIEQRRELARTGAARIVHEELQLACERRAQHSLAATYAAILE